MGLEELKPGNTRRAKATAIAAFKAFVKSESVDFEYVRRCIEKDDSGKCIVSILDMFGMYLAFNEGKKGKQLARNTAMQYYRQTKMWFFELFPTQRHVVEAKLLSMGKTLENFCMKRDGKVVSKAPPCCKADLRKMMLYLFKNASMSSDYQDAALLCMLWYLFGRASDLSLVQKRNLTIDAADILFVRFIRLKTSEEQGLSLFPDLDFVTCPVYAIALALMTQAAPCVDLLDNLPPLHVQATVSLSPATPLLEVLDHPAEYAALGAAAAVSTGSTTSEKTPTIYSHVNRVLDRIAAAAGVKLALSSHSFRRGGAQHVNGCEGLTHRWIFDRGAWNMSTTNKGFNYIFNTSREDHKVSKALSGYDTDAKVPLKDLKSFDAQTQEKIATVQHYLFAACFKLDQAKYNVSKRVLDVLTAYLLLHYPHLKELHPEGPAVKRLEACVQLAGSSLADLLAWATHLASAACNTKTQSSEETEIAPCKRPNEENTIIEHQRSVIDQLVLLVKRQNERMDILEAKVEGNTQQHKIDKRQREKEQEQEQDKAHKRRRTSVTHLHTTWYAWYAQEPRWLSDAPKQQRSNAKQLVGYMKLFIAEGFVLDPRAEDYRDRVLALGKQAEKEVLNFLRERDISSRGSTAVRKHLRNLHVAGALNDRISRHRRLIHAGAVQDPDRHDLLEPVATTL
ncbi:hypothetical protein AM587_10006285 [Phytophthora nicotianae]|uniref:Uncharacterized protein n=3 Tax=Phytophthora nicotianae TaxID=4792 RepID=A0A0W8CR41_PHYNI|nr:hypothetical protein AM587_10006284 [Phytophthora nicotianae]KUF86609.1 hypothetical protein AM587_10006285 [Phytophthora nicotianae]